MNQGWLYEERVRKVDAGITALDYYAARYRHSTLVEWRDRIVAGQILVDGNLTAPETLLKTGQHLAYRRSPWQEPEMPLNFEILYEDEDLWVVNKPSGLPVLPGGGFLEHTLLHQLQHRYPHNTPVPIHRLGRGTSGLMLLARSALAKSNLTAQMRDRQIRKTYHTLVVGNTMPDQFTINHPIGKIPHPVLGYIYGATADGNFAQSDCQVLKRNAETALLEVTILTGRPHQIRIHLAAAGYPLVGDPLYGMGGIPRCNSTLDTEKLPVPGDVGYHLHAYHLAFAHPRTHQILHILCPVPAE
jgi:23S rRNA pseudouridine1911/1915/1917 synthase